MADFEQETSTASDKLSGVIFYFSKLTTANKVAALRFLNTHYGGLLEDRAAIKKAKPSIAAKADGPDPSGSDWAKEPEKMLAAKIKRQAAIQADLPLSGDQKRGSRLAKTIREMLRATAGKWFSTDAVTQSLTLIKWQSINKEGLRNAAYDALYKMAKKGLIERRGSGQSVEWRFPCDEAAS